MCKQLFTAKRLGFFKSIPMLKISALIAIAISMLSLSVAHSQTSKSSKSLAVYTKLGKVFVADVLGEKPYKVISKQGQWAWIQFNQPTIPVWVSDDYVAINGDSATVTVNSSLNARMRPSLQSPILTRLSKGYTSEVIGTLAGFVNIYAPADLIMSIQNESRPQNYSLASSGSKSSTNKAQYKKSSADVWSIKPSLAKTVEKPVIRNDSNAVSVDDHKNQRTFDELSVPTKPALPKTAKQESDRELNQGSNKLEKADSRSESGSSKSSDSLVRESTDHFHKVAPGDEISVFVFGESDLSSDNLVVRESGNVSLPLIGSVSVEGKTVSEIETIIAERLSQGYVKNPKLSVTISTYRPIFIRGAVNNPGSFPFSAGLTISKVLTLAGGTKSFARIDGVSVLRDGVVIEDSLYLDSQYQIKSGDVISVTEDGFASDENAFIYLHGEVNSAGEYIYRKGLTVEKAIVLAGGFSLRASQRKITVTRYIEGQDEPIKLKRVKLYLPIKAGDIIKVGARLF